MRLWVLGIVVAIAVVVCAALPGRAVCDPAYPTICVALPLPDLDCADVGVSRFPVRPPDPHGFDGDRDGVGCE